MGHVRLGSLPRSRAWKEVVGLITAGADVSQIANATIRAADKAFTFVLNDEGFTEAVWLMTQLAIAAKKENLGEHLQSLGVNLPQDTSLPDLAAAVSEISPLDNKREVREGPTVEPIRPRCGNGLSVHWSEPWKSSRRYSPNSSTIVNVRSFPFSRPRK